MKKKKGSKKDPSVKKLSDDAMNAGGRIGKRIGKDLKSIK